MNHQTYSRVEFTTDLGFGQIQAAFVDFSSEGISFSVPWNMKMPGVPGSEQYQRVTVHTNGWDKTHSLIPTHHLKDFDQNKPALAQWKGVSPWSFGLGLDPESLKFMKQFFAKAKPNTGAHSTCLNVPVTFDSNAASSTVAIAITDHALDPNELAVVFPCEGQLWSLTGGWPLVIVLMSNVIYSGPDQLGTVGRDYQQSGQP